VRITGKIGPRGVFGKGSSAKTAEVNPRKTQKAAFLRKPGSGSASGMLRIPAAGNL